METKFEKKLKANELRKAKKYSDALTLYQDLFKECPDQFISAGYLHCLRKLKQFQEAIPLAESLIGKFFEFDWINNEIIWTFIEGLLYPLTEEDSLTDVLDIANKILHLDPNQIASNIVIMRVCKTAKKEKKWSILDEWIQKIDPNSLQKNPIILPNGKEGWNQQGLWYLYCITTMIELGKNNEAFSYLEYALKNFPKQKKFFLRLRALAFSKSGKKEEALADYRVLCEVPHPDWWMLKEYADILSDLNRKDEALKIMFHAAQVRQDPGLMVVLFEAIGDIFNQRGNKENAILHYTLTKLLREERTWKIPDSLNKKLSELLVNETTISSSREEIFQKCQAIWKQDLENSGRFPSAQFTHDVTLRRNISGKISLGRPDRPFCFINVGEGDSVFCYKDQLPLGVNDGDNVIVDARPSWDQKKNKRSWKAQNVRLKK